MDKWKDAELAKMQAGGNTKFREFLESQEDYDPCWSLQEKYSSRAAALFRDKVRGACCWWGSAAGRLSGPGLRGSSVGSNTPEAMHSPHAHGMSFGGQIGGSKALEVGVSNQELPASWAEAQSPVSGGTQPGRGCSWGTPACPGADGIHGCPCCFQAHQSLVHLAGGHSGRRQRMVPGVIACAELDPTPA